MNRERILSVTRDDFDWEYFRAGGKGGQNQNKTSSGVRIKHAPSGAVEESREGRDQLTNKRLAFDKMTKNPKFVAWLRITAAKLNGQPTPEEVVEKMLAEDNLRVEVKDERGRWTTDGTEALSDPGLR
jgi:hypothetical protein